MVKYNFLVHSFSSKIWTFSMQLLYMFIFFFILIFFLPIVRLVKWGNGKYQKFDRLSLMSSYTFRQVWPVKVACFSESAMCFSNLQTSKKEIFQITILKFKFKFPANNSKQTFKSQAQDSNLEYCFGDLEICKTNRTFWIKATFSAQILFYWQK